MFTRREYRQMGWTTALKSLQIAGELSSADMAFALGVTSKTYNNWLNGNVLAPDGTRLHSQIVLAVLRAANMRGERHAIEFIKQQGLNRASIYKAAKMVPRNDGEERAIESFAPCKGER